MTPRATMPRLRLVGSWPDADAAAERQRRQEVIRENRRAAQNPSLSPSDPRWTLAVRAHSQLQGTAMTPERRARVMRTAEQLGIRPFDANVIIAVVQDHARRGADLADAAPTLAGMNTVERNATSRDTTTSSIVTRLLLAAILAAMINALLITWLF